MKTKTAINNPSMHSTQNLRSGGAFLFWGIFFGGLGMNPGPCACWASALSTRVTSPSPGGAFRENCGQLLHSSFPKITNPVVINAALTGLAEKRELFSQKLKIFTERAGTNRGEKEKVVYRFQTAAGARV
jgi:hypothetical protein